MSVAVRVLQFSLLFTFRVSISATLGQSSFVERTVQTVTDGSPNMTDLGPDWEECAWKI